MTTVAEAASWASPENGRLFAVETEDLIDESAFDSGVLFNLQPLKEPTRVVHLPESPHLAEQRIHSMLSKASETITLAGLSWYFDAHNHCKRLVEKHKDQHGVSTEQVAGILAALSPQQSWEGNLRDTDAMITGRPVGALDHAVVTAREIREGGDPWEILYDPAKNNPKVRSFFSNIARPESSQTVTIDRHIFNFMCDRTDAIKQAGLRIALSEYQWIEARFKNVAAEYGYLPHQLQAIAWVWWRSTRLNKPIDPIVQADPLHPSIFTKY